MLHQQTSGKTEQDFQVWMAKVDAAVDRRTGGLSVHDLPDCCFRDWFEDDSSPAEAARRAIRNAKDEDAY